MFANLIESQSHGREFKRRGRFVLATAAAYTVLFFVAGIVSIYAYDARVEAQTDDLEIVDWIPPVTPVTPKPPRDVQPIRRPNQPVAPVDQHITIPERPVAVASVADPTKTPDTIGTTASPFLPVTGPVAIGPRTLDPPGPSGTQGGCATCNSTDSTPRVVEPTPQPTPQVVKPQLQKVSTGVLIAKVISLPQPTYPPIARQIHIGGAVAIQILVDEQGKVVSAQVVSGHPTLTGAARDAAMRARFTPTLLSGTPVKVQGTIVYNFVLQ
jgi:periplasmic protein TonB